MLAPKELMDEFRKVHQFNVFSVNHPTQEALAEYLKTPNTLFKITRFLSTKKGFIFIFIKESRFRFTPSKGTYFQVLNFKNITTENDYDFAIRLTKEQKIASYPNFGF